MLYDTSEGHEPGRLLMTVDALDIFSIPKSVGVDVDGDIDFGPSIESLDFNCKVSSQLNDDLASVLQDSGYDSLVQDYFQPSFCDGMEEFFVRSLSHSVVAEIAYFHRTG